MSRRLITLTNGVNPGDMIAVTAPIYGAGSFNWQIAAASAPTVMLQTAQTLGGRVTFSGLTPGVVYNVQVNAVGSAGTSAWSGVFSLMAV